MLRLARCPDAVPSALATAGPFSNVADFKDRVEAVVKVLEQNL